MPETNFEIWIDGETKILVHRRTEKGRYVTFAVVLMIATADGWMDIGRFDTAHGIPHQDILGEKNGLLQKVWLDDITPRKAFHLAITTFERDHERIRIQYHSN